jgi:FlaA1/EpsC-like NDP-sugar epimerase
MERMKAYKIYILLLIDIFLINLSYITALSFKFNGLIPALDLNLYLKSAFVITIIYISSLYFFRLYKSLWNYAGIDEFLFSVGGCISGNFLAALYFVSFDISLSVPVNILAGVFCIIYVVGFRMSFRICRRLAIYLSTIDKRSYKRVLVIGAGSGGTLIINEMKRCPKMKYQPVALVDDNRGKIGTTISGVKVLGNRDKIKDIVQQKAVEEIIIAIPSLTGEGKKELFDICKRTGCKVKTIPGLMELIEGRVTLQQIRDVDVEDLLGRDPVVLDPEGIAEYIENQVVLVTGGGGSIGSELCRQIAKFKPAKLLILDIYENNAYELQNELKYSYPKLDHRVIIASVRDKRRMESIFSEYRPEVVFHAAAHKHVPLMEDNPTEAVSNNVFGTLTAVECADKYGTKRFVLISTDKAVNPTNIMGASKRVCEMIIQAMDKISKTKYVAVRFGNVLGSNGSVIPLFKRQIADGGPITVTNKYITRYFMTIPEAAQLVLQAGAFAAGGEIFVLDMGKPVKIYDLACDLIRLSGFEPHRDIKIDITGLRPGEKLYEELLMAEEGLSKTKHEKIFIGRPTYANMEELRNSFHELSAILENGTKEELIEKIGKLVPTYRRVEVVDNSCVVKAEVAAEGGQNPAPP